MGSCAAQPTVPQGRRFTRPRPGLITAPNDRATTSWKPLSHQRFRPTSFLASLFEAYDAASLVAPAQGGLRGLEFAHQDNPVVLTHGSFFDFVASEGYEAHVAKDRIAFMACSLDGFIAGPDDSLGFLEPQRGQQVEDTFTPFFAGVGALLIGRRTFDVVNNFDGDWPYGETPVLVLTHRTIESRVSTVQAVSGGIESAVAQASEMAGDRDVYIDGGELVRQSLDKGLVDELVITIVPRILGRGRPLFAGVHRRHDLELTGHKGLGAGFVELRYRPLRPHP